MTVLSRLQWLYHRLPASWRSSGPARTLAEAGKRALATHQDVYTAEYYRNDVEGPAARAAPLISASILADLRPRRAIDVGCGTGALLEALQAGGCDCVGLEYADAGLQLCAARGVRAIKHDIERDPLPVALGRFDVAISTEVAEHLPEPCADRYVDLLASLSDVVVMTAAPPGQGGLDHVNEQPRAYWIGKFGTRGFDLDASRTDRWQQQWRHGGAEGWYWSNLMVFCKRA